MSRCMNEVDNAPTTKRLSLNLEDAVLWATRAQIAKRYAVHPGTIDTWRRSGFLPAFVFGSRLVRFDIKACDTWFESYRHGAKWETDRRA
jgi:hypothetical protein